VLRSTKVGRNTVTSEGPVTVTVTEPIPCYRSSEGLFSVCLASGNQRRSCYRFPGTSLCYHPPQKTTPSLGVCGASAVFLAVKYQSLPMSSTQISNLLKGRFAEQLRQRCQPPTPNPHPQTLETRTPTTRTPQNPRDKKTGYSQHVDPQGKICNLRSE